MRQNVSDRELASVLQQVSAAPAQGPTVVEHDYPSRSMFDPSVIESFARKLYFHAGLMVMWYGFLGFVSGCAAAGMLYYYLPAPIAHQYGGTASLATVILFVAIGCVIGNSKAFDLRFRAQSALCQLQIERNTRAGARA